MSGRHRRRAPRTLDRGAATLPRTARTAGRVFTWVVAGSLLTLAAGAVWVGIRGVTAYDNLREVQDGAPAAASSIADDPGTATAELVALSEHASEAHRLTADPVWRAAQRVPWVGPQLAAFATITAATDDLLTRSLLPLAASAGDLSLDSLRPTGGHVDAAALAPIAAPAAAAAKTALDAADDVAAIPRGPLVGVVSRAVDDADTLFGQVSGSMDAVARAAQLLPPMLGQEGPRTYLVLVQNNAEWRSLGGIAGAGIIVHVDDGGISLAGTVSTRDFPAFAAPVAALPDEVTAIFDTKPAQYFQNTTQIPDFTVGAPLAREMYRLQSGIDVDGVLAIDPVVLSYLLRATGPIALPTGDVLTSENAVPLLLNEVYFRYSEPAQQDAFFAAAAAAVFQTVADGGVETSALLTALGRAGDERRLLVWSAHPDEQSLLAGGAVAGELPTSDDRTARFGVYLNDGTGSKMSYYIQPRVDLTWTGCAANSRLADRQVTLTLDLTSTAPGDAATSLPSYVTGNGTHGALPGDTETVGNIYLPEGFELVSATSSTGETFASGTHEGRRVLTVGITLEPGASSRITVVARATTTVSEAQAVVTPTADPELSPTIVASCGTR